MKIKHSEKLLAAIIDAQTAMRATPRFRFELLKTILFDNSELTEVLDEHRPQRNKTTPQRYKATQ